MGILLLHAIFYLYCVVSIVACIGLVGCFIYQRYHDIVHNEGRSSHSGMV